MYQSFNEWLKEQVKKQTKQIGKQQNGSGSFGHNALSGPNWQTWFRWLRTLAYWQTDLEKQRSHQKTIEAKIPSGAREKDRTGKLFIWQKESIKHLPSNRNSANRQRI